MSARMSTHPCHGFGQGWIEPRLGPRELTEEEETQRAQELSVLIIEATRRFNMSEDAITRCKVKVHRVTRNINEKGEVDSETVELNAVYSSDPNSENAK